VPTPKPRPDSARSAAPFDGRWCGGARVLLLAPHPDDESLANAVLLNRVVTSGGQARVIYLTDGENNPWSQRAAERRWNLGSEDRRRWGRLRRLEALRALGCLGLPSGSSRFLGLPDQGITAELETGGQWIVDCLHRELCSWRPTLFVIPALADRHPDHSAAAVLSRIARARAHGCRPQPLVLEYFIHPPRSVQAGLQEFALWPRPQEREVKRRAILRHASQLWFHSRDWRRLPDQPERFSPGFESDLEDDLRHPLRLVGAEDTRWIFAIRHSLRMRLGRPALLLVVRRGSDFEVLRLTAVGRAGRRPIMRGAEGEVVGEAGLSWQGRELRVSVTSPLLSRAEQCLARLDVGRERQWGLFDAWPWRSYGLASDATTGPGSTMIPGRVTARGLTGSGSRAEVR
jgi:LmbE family N-acetylglucosaminyl deacetylase